MWRPAQGPVVDEQEFEVFKMLNGGGGARSPGPVWVEPESLDDVAFVCGEELKTAWY